MAASYFIRRLTPLDQLFLWEMLYQSLYVPEGGRPFPRAAVHKPELAKYVERWGRAGDLGLVATDSSSIEPIGAAWLRLLTGDASGYGYVDDETPELGIAVLPEHRGRGIGSDLLRHLIESAKAIYPSICLSVSLDNPALRLYERMGFERVGVRGSSVTMIRRLRA
ncbi:MAG: GNAT family N-acetyltransferase [Pyrinomonadaceae bacterium]